MQPTSLLVRVAAIGAALFSMHTAFASDISRDDFNRFVSTKTRAEVIAEVIQARADGTLMTGNEISRFSEPLPTQRSRDEVRAEAWHAARFMVRDDFNRGG
jgi:hypothetical protein